MRKLVWIAVGFVVGCLVCAYLLDGWWLLLPAAMAALCAVGCAFVKNKTGRCAALSFLGAAIAFLWFFAFDSFYLSHIRNLDGQKVETSVEIVDYSYRTDYGVAADGKLQLEGRSYRVRLYLYEETMLSPGDRVEGTVNLRYTPRGGLDEMTHHQGKGIFLLGYFRDDAVICDGDATGVKYFPARMRQGIKNTLDALFPEDTVAFARALLLGDSSLLSYKENADLSVSGIRHIVAVSGLHVSILFSVVFSFFGYRRVLTPIVGLPLLVLFAALAGFTPSVTRACLMQGLMLLALAADKEYDPPTALAFSVLVILFVNPLTVTSVSFQLSVSCIIGILGFSERISQWFLAPKRLGPAKGKSLLARFKRWFAGSISVTLSAMVFTVPLCGMHFGMISIVSVLTNLLCLWVVSALFCAIMAACILGVIFPAVGKAIAWAASWLIRYIFAVSGALASVPYSAMYTKSVYTIVWIVLCYALMAVYILSKPKRTKLFVGCIAVGLFISAFFSWLEPRLDNYRMTVLDVGEGQCILLQAQESIYIVDCGGDYAEEAADLASHTLLSQGVRKVDGVIVSHYDQDHAGGVAALLSRINAEKVYMPDVDEGGAVRTTIEKTAEDICWIGSNDQLSIQDGLITIFSGKATASDNESSVCVLFQPENCDILIIGDRSSAGERELVTQNLLPDLEVLVVGHHGSKTSTCIELLHTTRPEIAVISVGDDNRYGHPANQVLQRLERYGCRILRTDEDGDVIIRG